MLYKFKSKAGGDVIMLGPQGDQLLRVMGREPSPKGIMLPVDLPAAISALEQAVAADEAAFAQAQLDTQAAGEPALKRVGIQLRQRAWPLLELMRHALAEDVDIVWGV